MLRLFFIVGFCAAFDYFYTVKDMYFDTIEDMYSLRANNKKPLDLSATFFPSLENYESNALVVNEKKYPWIARVVHSTTRNVPHICTAVCIHDGVFITAARCIMSLKVRYTSVIYKSLQLPVRAFVLPSQRTLQAFDDIGFLVIEKNSMKYDVIKLFNEVNRTDEAFMWFRKMNLSRKYKVVGHAVQKGIHKVRDPERVYSLKELPVVIGSDICPSILANNYKFDEFKVPCYHSCTVKEFRNEAKNCLKYLGAEGSAVVEVKSNKLFGVAIWGAIYYFTELPVGFSVVNSKAFFEDYECAKKIRVANLAGKNGGYQQFCH